MAELRYLLLEAFDWGAVQARLRRFVITIAMRLWMARRENGGGGDYGGAGGQGIVRDMSINSIF